MYGYITDHHIDENGNDRDFITFILGLLAARWILYRKSDATRIFWDGIFTMPLVLPPTVAGFFLLVFSDHMDQ